MISTKAAEEYFAEHLLGEIYTAAESDKKRRALATANSDIAAEIGAETVCDTELFAVAAVCEQTLYLLTEGERVAGVGADISSESESGIGSRSWRNRDRTIAPRAARYLSWFHPQGCWKISRG